jgi:glycosyltransferase involved in cell wall biosynthesis
MGKVGQLAKEQHLLMRPYQGLRKYFSRLVHHVTAPSQFVLDLHQKMGFFALAETRVVPNSHGFGLKEIDRNFLGRSKPHKKISATRFLYVGRIDKAKGVDLLCQAFVQAASQHPGMLLRVAGWGPLDESLREKYRNQNNIIFTGPVFGVQKNELFRDSDMLVTPSLAPESFGIVIAEAFSYGLPVIATRVGAYTEIVQEGQTGFFVNPGSVEDIFSALLKAGKEPLLIDTMSWNCIEQARRFTSEKFLGDYLALYQDNLENRNL